MTPRLWCECLCSLSSERSACGAAKGRAASKTGRKATERNLQCLSHSVTQIQALWDNSLAVFSLENTLYYHLPSVASTTLLVQTNWDYDYQLFSQQNNLMPKTMSQGMLDAGWYMPLVLPAAVYGWGFAWGDSSWQMHGASALQALGLTGGFTMALKSITGRRGPDKDLANPGATTRSWVVGVLSYGLATTMGYAMIDGDHHWLSDVISGALLHVVGWTVGTSFRNRDQPLKAGSWRLTPMTGFGYNGLGVAWYF
jgi:hypothetical protein